MPLGHAATHTEPYTGLEGRSFEYKIGFQAGYKSRICSGAISRFDFYILLLCQDQCFYIKKYTIDMFFLSFCS